MTDLYSQLDSQKRKDYERGISAAAALSRLFSDNLYLNPKVMERAYCRFLSADNVALDNAPADAKMIIDDVVYGIGLKTFGIHKYSKIKTEKIAEFDKLKHKYTKDVDEDARLVIDAWNERLKVTENIYDIDVFRYHCLTRCDDTIFVNEYSFGELDVEDLSVKETVGGFSFDVNDISYSFNYGKSVLYRSFDVKHPICSFKVKVFDDPFDDIMDFYDNCLSTTTQLPQLVLPLFSVYHNRPYVYPKSGLNQWNASGDKRKRSISEIYIPYNKYERDASKGFFPEYMPGSKRNKEHFIVHLPSGKTVEASLCQSEGKGIMSVDNDDFGEWLLFDVLGMKEGEVVTMDHLEDRQINAVIFTKLREWEYNLDFSYVDPDSYLLDRSR